MAPEGHVEDDVIVRHSVDCAAPTRNDPRHAEVHQQLCRPRTSTASRYLAPPIQPAPRSPFQSGREAGWKRRFGDPPPAAARNADDACALHRRYQVHGERIRLPGSSGTRGGAATSGGFHPERARCRIGVQRFQTVEIIQGACRASAEMPARRIPELEVAGLRTPGPRLSEASPQPPWRLFPLDDIEDLEADVAQRLDLWRSHNNRIRVRAFAVIWARR